MAVVGLLLLRLIMCLVFGLAGITKLVDTPGTRQTLRYFFGVPTGLVAPFGLLLPLIELVTAVLLAIGDLAWWGALAAFVLLSVFTVAIVTNIVRGRRPNCRCFGAWSAKPISGKTVVRNVVLALIALLFILVPRDDIPQLRDLSMSVEGVVAWWLAAGLIVIMFLLLAVLVEGWLIVQLLQQHGRLLIRLDRIEAHLGIQSDTGSVPQEMTGLPPGTPAPPFELLDLNGNPQQLLSLLL